MMLLSDVKSRANPIKKHCKEYSEKFSLIEKQKNSMQQSQFCNNHGASSDTL